MKKAILFFTLSILFFRCSPFDRLSQNIKKETKKENGARATSIAKNKDSINNRYFIFRDNNHFECVDYRICSPKCKLKYFTGIYNEKNDTIFLEYYKNYRPIGMENYLIKGPSGEYLLFSFVQNTTKQHLKIKRRES